MGTEMEQDLLALITLIEPFFICILLKHIIAVNS